MTGGFQLAQVQERNKVARISHNGAEKQMEGKRQEEVFRREEGQVRLEGCRKEEEVES